MARTATTITVRNQFEAQHRWKEAPEDVKFLRNWHRHVFHVRSEVYVRHDNRAVEFFQLQRCVHEVIEGFGAHGRNSQFEASCETFARLIYDRLEALGYIVMRVTVSEDDENEATIYGGE